MQILTRLMRCCQTQLRLGSVNRLFRCRSIITQLGKMFYEYHGSMHSKRCATEEKNLPWMSKSTPHAILRRNHMYKRAKSSGSHVSWKKYKGLRNKVTSMLQYSNINFSIEVLIQETILESCEVSE